MTRKPLVAAVALAGSLAVPLRAATYLPMSDADLAAGAPVIVRATPVSQEVRLERVGGDDLPFTIVTLQRVEALRGAIGETFSVRLPGGRAGGSTWFLPGVPRLPIAGDVVLMLRPAAGHPGEWHLTELGLSEFELGVDEAGRRFAVRPEFGAVEDLDVSKRADAANAARAKSSAVPARDGESFLAAMRAVGRGEPMPDVVLAEPRGAIGRPHGVRAKWVNIGGREPGDCDGEECLFRWFWESGAPDASVKVVGTQSGLSTDDAAGCGTDSICDVQNGVDGWHGVAGTDVHVTGPAATGTVTVNLDAASSQDNGATWSTPFGCQGGVIGLGGPGNVVNAARTYRGDTSYYGIISGTVSMRKSSCASGYSARTFKTAVMHELGHVLGLGHPNQDQSIHTTTSASDWSAAVMTSSVPASKPEAPQADDVQAMQFLYGTAAVSASPSAGFTFSPSAPAAGAAVSFTDTSTNSPTGWQWDFGDASSGAANGSRDRNPAHTFSTPGTYSVRLSAGSVNGTGTVSRNVVVAPGTGAAPCVVSPTTLCLNAGRFAVTATYRTSNGQSGNGTGVALTTDSGYFWFFSPANIEVVVKVLNACGLNPPRYWVFAAGLTNVEVHLNVTDTQTGGSPQAYTNPLNTPFAPIQDTDAFSTCP